VKGLEYYKENLELLLKMVAVQSDTGTVKEKEIENFIYEYLSKIPRLQQEGTFGKCPVEHDPFEREVVWGLLKNESSDTVVLLNHHDAVDSEDYGAFKQYAYNPAVLKDQLRTLDHSDEVKKDLEDENWIFGRGTADMKGGAAVQLNLLKRYCERKRFRKNILFLSVPDEETLSSGMRRGVSLMAELKDRYGLNYKLLINSEPHDRIQGKPTIYDGSVGKTMAAICIKGKKTHIGEIFQGLNPASILSRIVIQTEANADFSDKDLEEVSTPPSWSYVRDFKESYDASVPEYAGGYLSFLTLNKTPREILENLRQVCEEAFRNTVDCLVEEYRKIHGDSSEAPYYNPRVILYEELLRDALLADPQSTGEILEDSYKTVLQKLKTGEANVPECNFKIMIDLMKIARYNSPVVAIALSPPYYPHVSSQKDAGWSFIEDKLKTIFNEADVRRKHYFMGISDNSYAGLQNSADVVPYVSPNMPLWREGLYTLPFEDMKQLSMPALIVGPWGKDLHKITERVYLPDLVENTPMMIEKIIEELL